MNCCLPRMPGGVPVSRIGRVVSGKGIRVWDEEGGQIVLEKYGFDHFA